MNIYNILYCIEYTKDPVKSYANKYWYSYQQCKNIQLNRNFDLPAVIFNGPVSYNINRQYYKYWYKYSELHRLIGPAVMQYDYKNKYRIYYYLNGYINEKSMKKK